MIKKVPNAVIKCLKILKNAEIDAYLVGGCVRDLLMDKEPNDYDVAVNAEPLKLKKLFNNSIDTGIKHGTITVIVDKMPIEITQMRIDGEYINHRKPISISPAVTIVDDLKRRDFTINSMALTIDNELIDVFGGLADIQKKTIKCVGEPANRFNEDALRILRAFRFASVLDFKIENKTLDAAKQQAYLLKEISVERTFSELIKLLMGQKPQCLQLLLKNNSLSFLSIDYFNPLCKIAKLPLNRELRFAALLFLCNADANIVCGALKTDNKLKISSNWLLNKLNSEINFSDLELKRLMFEKDFDSVFGLLTLIEALKEINLTNQKNSLQSLKSHPIYIKDLAVNGNDLISFGINETDISKLFSILLDRVHRQPELNNKNDLMAIVKSIDL